MKDMKNIMFQEVTSLNYRYCIFRPNVTKNNSTNLPEFLFTIVTSYIVASYELRKRVKFLRSAIEFNHAGIEARKK